MSEKKVTRSENTVLHHATVTRERREQLSGHRSALLWFTGLSGSGKSTLAHGLEERLYRLGCHTFVLDGDNVRHGLCGDLDFSRAGRHENIRRIAEMSSLFRDVGVIALAAFISPFRADREMVRGIVGPEDFIEVYCRCSLEICEERDTKGLYRRARNKEIHDFTGISSPYEEPEAPVIVLDTGTTSLDVCVERLLELLVSRGILAHGRLAAGVKR